MRRLCVAALTAAVLAACGDDFTLPPASIQNEIDTVAIYALSGTPVALPSGYQIELKRAVRTDQTAFFDFAFDIPPSAAPRFYPTGPLGLGEGSGFLRQTAPFDSVTFAPLDGYVRDSGVVADSGAVYVVRSRPVSCTFGTFAYFAKLRVLAVDTTARRVDFEVVANANCGYRSLEPGTPTR
jgi:hypothetical protein